MEEGGTGMVTESGFVIQSKMTESAIDKTLGCPEGGTEQGKAPFPGHLQAGWCGWRVKRVGAVA